MLKSKFRNVGATEQRNDGATERRNDGATKRRSDAREGGRFSAPLRASSIHIYLSAGSGLRLFWRSVRGARPNCVNLGRVLSIWARFFVNLGRFCQFGHVFCQFGTIFVNLGTFFVNLARFLLIWVSFCQFGHLFVNLGIFLWFSKAGTCKIQCFMASGA